MNDETKQAPAPWETAADEAAVRLQHLTGKGTVLTSAEASDLRAVLVGLRNYRLERDGAQATADRVIKMRAESERDGKIRMRRIWALVDHARNTVPMDALYEALKSPIAQAQAADAVPAGGEVPDGRDAKAGEQR